MTVPSERLGSGWPRPRFLTGRFAAPLGFSASGWRWWLADEDEGVREALLLFDHYLETGEATGVSLLRDKAARSRWIYHVSPAGAAEEPGYFVKQMVLAPRKRLGALLGCSNPWLGCVHGTAELARNLELHERTRHGIRTFAFGEYFRWGLPAGQVLVQEYLAGWQSFTAAWQQHAQDAARRRALLRQLLEVLESLRDAGICHLDLHPGNLMVSPDPQAPLRVVDCGQMCLGGDPALSAALHLGVFLHELNGKRMAPSPTLAEGARELLHRLAGGEAALGDAERLLPLLLGYSTKKPFSRRTLLQCRGRAFDPDALERRLRKLALNRPVSLRATRLSASGERQERQLIASIDEMLC